MDIYLFISLSDNTAILWSFLSFLPTSFYVCLLKSEIPIFCLFFFKVTKIISYFIIIS